MGIKKGVETREDKEEERAKHMVGKKEIGRKEADLEARMLNKTEEFGENIIRKLC